MKTMTYSGKMRRTHLTYLVVAGTFVLAASFLVYIRHVVVVASPTAAAAGGSDIRFPAFWIDPRPLIRAASCMLSTALWPRDDWTAVTRPNYTFPDGVTVQYGKLFDKFDFAGGYIRPNRGACENATVVAVVMASPDGLAQRTAIRDTWGGTLRDMTNGTGRVVFYIGNINDTEKQRRIDAEAELYGDIVQSRVPDGTRLSLIAKEVGTVKWVSDVCPKDSLKYALKMDDDLYLNVPRLLEYLGSGAVTPGTMHGLRMPGFCGGLSMGGLVPEVTSSSPPDLFPFDVPPFIGATYLYARDVADQLVDAAGRANFWDVSSDLFVTGVLRVQTRNVTIVHDARVTYLYGDLALDLLPEPVFARLFRSAVIVAHSYGVYRRRAHLSPDMIYKIHRLLRHR